MTEYFIAINKPTVAMCNNLDESYNFEQKKPDQYILYPHLYKAQKQAKLLCLGMLTEVVKP